MKKPVSKHYRSLYGKRKRRVKVFRKVTPHIPTDYKQSTVVNMEGMGPICFHYRNPLKEDR